MVTLDEQLLPLPAPRPIELDEAMQAGLHLLAALAGGIAAMQLLAALAHGDVAGSVLLGSALAVLLAAAFLQPRPRWQGTLFAAAGLVEVVVWVAVSLQVDGVTMLVGLGMAAGSAAVTRLVLLPADGSRSTRPPLATREERPSGWIEELGAKESDAILEVWRTR